MWEDDKAGKIWPAPAAGKEVSCEWRWDGAQVAMVQNYILKATKDIFFLKKKSIQKKSKYLILTEISL